MSDVLKKIEDLETKHVRGGAEEVLPEHEIYTHQQLVNLPLKGVEWIVGQLIPCPGLVVMTGRPGSYKTFFALWLATRVAAGLPLFERGNGEFTEATNGGAVVQCPVLFIEEENTLQTMKGRLAGFGLGVSQGGCDIQSLYMVETGFKVSNSAWRERVKQIVKEKGVRLLVRDPFSSVMGLNSENDNAEVAKVLDVLRREFVRDCGLSVILIHHPSKGDTEGKGVRGAGDILGKCDVHLSIEIESQRENLVRVMCEKLRVADIKHAWNFKTRLASSADGYARFVYGGEAKSKGEEEHDRLKQKMLSIFEDGEEYTQRDVASAIEQKPGNSRFRSVWEELMRDSVIMRNAVTKKCHKRN